MSTTIRVGTFNVENLFCRYKFVGQSPKRKRNEPKEKYEKRLKAIRQKQEKLFKEEGAPLEWFRRDMENFDVIYDVQRKMTAKVIEANNPHIVALQEVESMEALRKFNSRPFFKAPFKYELLIDGNDNRGIDVAVLSRLPIINIRTHIFDLRADGYSVFPRDCLEVDIAYNENDLSKTLTLLINHFTSRLSDKTGEKRERQANRVMEIIRARYSNSMDTSQFIIMGDLNDSPKDPSLRIFYDTSSPLHNPVLNLDTAEQWSHYWYAIDEETKEFKRNREVSLLDHILLSPALTNKVVGKARIERRGLLPKVWDMSEVQNIPREDPFSGKKIKEPGDEASDHCPIFVDLALTP